MKKLSKNMIAVVLCILFIIPQCFITAFAYAKDETIDGYVRDIKAVTVYDLTESKMLYSKNASDKISVASTTKLVTALVALEYVHPDTVFKVGTELRLVKPNSSLCGLSASSGHTLKLRTLIAGMLLPSGNDAAYTVAVNVARIHSGNNSMSDSAAVAYFCNLMNEYCKNLGCLNTNFVNPEGWDNTYHYSTANDMTLVAIEATKNAIISSIAGIHENKFYFASGHHITWTNSNKLLDPESQYYYPYAKGLKTGTTNSAGKCLISYADVNGRKILICVYGAKTENDRFLSAKNIFTYLYIPPMLGDVDKNGSITAADARMVLRASVGLEELSTVMYERGDTDSDGKITASDARKILRVAVGLESM